MLKNKRKLFNVEILQGKKFNINNKEKKNI
jgi:hypothetical protein